MTTNQLRPTQTHKNIEKNTYGIQDTKVSDPHVSIITGSNDPVSGQHEADAADWRRVDADLVHQVPGRVVPYEHLAVSCSCYHVDLVAAASAQIFGS